MIERAVDYIQSSLWLSEGLTKEKSRKSLPPVSFYPRGYLHPLGFRIYFGNPNSKKAMVVADGQTMQSLRNDQHQDAEILDWILSKGGEISRLDLAVTEWLEDELLILEDVEKWYTEQLIDSYLVAGGLKEISSFSKSSSRVRETLYIGEQSKRGKKGIFRAYDKGLELKLSAQLATRIELEIRKQKAHSVARRLAQTNDVAGNFRTHFNVNSSDFERLMDAQIVPATRGKNIIKEDEEAETARRWDWLLNQVAPSLRQAIQEERKNGRGDARLTAFMDVSGIMRDAREIANRLADKKYRDKLESNELVERKKE